MHEESDSEFARYFSYLNLFAAFMLVLVLGANFLVMFVGWEGVGLCSYLLIGFWYQKKSASDAGKKAFIVNRIGDFGFILGVLLLFVRFGTLDFQEVARAAAGAQPGDGVRHGVADHAAAVRRRDRQVGADSALRLAAGRDGRPDAGLRADPRRDDGDGGRLHDRPQRRAVQPRAADAGDRRGHRRRDGAHGRHDRPGAERHQARARVLDRVAARLHVPGDGRRRVRRRHLPSLHARVLQGAAVPRIGRGDSRAGRRAGPAAHGRPEEASCRSPTGRSSSARSRSPACPGLAGFFSKDEILYPHVRERPHAAVGRRAADVAADRDLHVPPRVPGVPRAFAFRVGPARRMQRRSRTLRPAPDAPEHPAPARTAHLHDAPPAMALALIVLAIGSVVAGYVGLPAVLGGSNWFEHFLEPSFGVARGGGSGRARPRGDC